MSTAYKYVFRNEIHKMKEIESSIFHDNEVSLNRISVSNELEWIIYTFEEMKIKYFIGSTKRNNRLISIYKENLVSPYSENNNFYNRIIKLQFKANLNFQFYKILFQKMPSTINMFEAFIYNMIQYTDITDNDRTQIKDTFHDYLNSINKVVDKNQLNGYIANIEFLSKIHKELLNDSDSDKKYFGKMNTQFIGHLITDSIHALHEIIKHTSIYGVSFSLNHSFIANTHYRLYQWTQYLDWFNIFQDLYKYNNNNKDDLITRFINHEKKFSINARYKTVSKYIDNLNIILKNKSEFKKEYNIEHELKLLIDQDEISYIKEFYQAEKAINNYYSALETHTEGKAYKDFLNNIYYLNDDFNDNFFHFSIALERYRLNTGKIAEILDNLKKIVSSSSIYNYDNYLKTIIN